MAIKSIGRGRLAWTVIATALILSATRTVVMGQQQPAPQQPPPFTVTNGYLRASVTAPIIPQPAQNAPNWGDVVLQNAAGEPLLQDDGAFLTLPTNGVDVALRLDYSPTSAGNVVRFGTAAQGTPVSTSVQGTLIEEVWQQTAGFGAGGTATPATNIIVRQRIRVIRDIAMYEYEIENGDTATSHAVELRLIVDTYRGAADDGPVYISTVGKVTAEAEYLDVNVPEQYLILDNEANITVTAQGIFRGLNVTTPDRLVVAYAPDIMASAFDYTVTPTKSITTDACFACYWKQVTLAPGEKTTYRIYYGNGLATHHTEATVDVAMVAPFALQLTQDNTDYANSPFQVIAAVTNMTGADLLGGSAVLSPEVGLALDGVDPTLELPVIQNDSTGQVTWTVRATKDRTGLLGMNCRVGAMGLAAAALRRTINVPAVLGTSISANLGRGLRFISFPFNFLNNDLTQALRITDDNGVENSPELIAVYDPENPENDPYDLYPFGMAGELIAGRAYWFYVDSNRTISAVGGFGNIQFLNTQSLYLVDLKLGRNGWNGIGCPFSYAIQLGQTQFLYQGNLLPYADAVRAGWVRGSVWYWDPTVNGNQGGYGFMGDAASYLTPWTGYWMKILVDCDLVVQPGGVFGAPPPVGTLSVGTPVSSQASAAKARSSSATARDWLLELGVTSGEWSDFGNYIGVSPGAQSGPDALDVEKPPLPQAVSLAISNPRWGARAGLFMQDVRSAAVDENSWDVKVTAAQSGQAVTVSWPTIRYLPRGLEPILEDLDSGCTVFMRRAPSYTFTSRDGAVRNLRITVGPPGRGLRLVGVSAQALARGRGASLAYTLSAPASVDIVVFNAAGRKVRAVVQDRAMPAGSATATWDGRSDAGTVVPPGVYRLQVTARSEGGGQVTGFGVVTLR